jgi:Flp pilus assembly pilin Flp
MGCKVVEIMSKKKGHALRFPNARNVALWFCREEDGAVTVDWVVLTAVIVGVAIGMFPIISDGLFSLSSDISAGLISAAGSL